MALMLERGKLLQKKWCAEGATIPSLKLNMKLIISPMNQHVKKQETEQKTFASLALLL